VVRGLSISTRFGGYARTATVNGIIKMMFNKEVVLSDEELDELYYENMWGDES
jgi:hypothetical protein